MDNTNGKTQKKMMDLINNDVLKKAECAGEICISLSGILPEFVEERFYIAPGRFVPGFCASIVQSSTSVWEIVQGCEELLNSLYLVVKSAWDSVIRKTAEKIKVIYKRAKTLVHFSAPRFLRL